MALITPRIVVHGGHGQGNMQLVASRANEACWSFTAVPDNGYTLESMRITSKQYFYGSEDENSHWHWDPDTLRVPSLVYTSYWDQPIQGLSPDSNYSYAIIDYAPDVYSTDFLVEMWFTIPDIPIFESSSGKIQYASGGLPHYYPRIT